MLNHFIISVAVLGQLLGLTIPFAIEEQKHSYIVPTVVSEQQDSEREADDAARAQKFEWQIKKKLYTEQAAPSPTGNVINGAKINARTALVMDVSTQQVLWQLNPDKVAPIASITKLMNALIWLDNKPAAGYEHIHTVAPEQDTPEGKELNLPHGAQLTTEDLLNISLIASDNDIAMGLAQSTSLSDSAYVKKMNKKAKALGLTNTTFADQTGLDTDNQSTAHDIALLALEAFSKPAIEAAASLPDYSFTTVDGGISRRVYTTNDLLFDDEVEIVAAKTGYLIEAGYCLVVKARVPESDRTVIAVVLGANSDEERFSEMKKLLTWTFNNYAWN